MRIVDDDVVCDVGVQCHLVVLRRRVDSDAAAGVVRHEVVGDRQHARVLDEDVNHRRRGDVERSDAAVLNVVRLEDDAWVVVADVAEHESATLVACHRRVRNPLFFAGSCVIINKKALGAVILPRVNSFRFCRIYRFPVLEWCHTYQHTQCSRDAL